MEEEELLLIIIFMQAWYTLNYIYWTIYTEIRIEKIRGNNWSATILIEIIFERIRSVHARAVIDVWKPCSYPKHDM